MIFVYKVQSTQRGNKILSCGLMLETYYAPEIYSCVRVKGTYGHCIHSLLRWMRLLNENGVCLLTDVSTQLGQIKKVREIALYEA